MRQSGVVVKVPGKVNLQLSVGPKESDGFHEVVTVFQAIALYDEVTVRFARTGETLPLVADTAVALEITGGTSHGVPIDKTNLAYRAAQVMIDSYDLDVDLNSPIAITLKKEIPVAGGMAGGSADAAGVIVAIDALFELGLSRNEMEKIASTLGSDVPFSISGGVAIGRGRGDQITPVLAQGTYHWVLALSNQGLSTPAVYNECDRLREGLQVAAPTANDQLLAALRAGDAKALGAALTNDLQNAACSLRPALRLVLDVGREYGALGNLVSGSGPTVAFLVDNDEKALDLAVALSASGVVGGVIRSSGPTHGARVIQTLH
jgi:4-diphosphocytidyl-2-C-methyl-D-erythritol kinase